MPSISGLFGGHSEEETAEQQEQRENTDTYACPECQKEFSSEKQLEEHKEQHTPVFEAEELEKFKTGIPGFDDLLSEGLPTGSSILVEGGPGSGKTVFCLSLMHYACNHGKKVLYMSFEEPTRRLVSHMQDFGFNPTEFIKQDTLRVKRYNALDISRSVEALLSEAKRELLIDVKPMFFPEDFEPDIVIIDSLTSIASAFSGQESRFRIYMEQLFRYLEKEDITSFLIRETPQPTHLGNSRGGAEEAVSFLSDGIVILYNVFRHEGTRQSALEILKMRGENFEKRLVPFEIASEKGFTVYPDGELSGKYSLT